MKKFNFRFQPVEDVKKRQEDQKREHLAEANKTLRGQEDRLADLHNLRDDCHRQIVKRTRGRLNAAELVLSNFYLQKVTGDIQRQRKEVSRSQKEVETRRETLIQTARERKMLESLKERERAAHLYKENRKEQAQLDEIAGRRGNRLEDGNRI